MIRSGSAVADAAAKGTARGGTARRAWHAAASAFAALAGCLAMPVALATVSVTLATSNANPFAGGGAFAYTVAIANDSTTTDATDVLMTLPLPRDIVLVNNNLVITETSPIAPPMGTTRGFFACDTMPAQNQNGTIVCRAANFPASTVATPTTASIQVVVQALATAAAGTRDATARVVANGVSDSDTRQVTVHVTAPLSIAISGPTAAGIGDNLVYRITLNNSGTSTATGATLSDPLPPNTTFVALSGTAALHDRCWYDPVANAVQCADVVQPTGTSFLNVVVDTPNNSAPGMVTNTATLTSAGTGTISGSSSAQKSTTLNLSVPDPPTGVYAIPGNATMTVNFTAPDNIGGSLITGYTSTCTPQPSGPTTQASGPGSPMSVSGVNGVTYTCTVHATNGQGNSAESEPSNPVTPSAPGAATLNVTFGGTGSGYVESNPPGIACPADCSESYPLVTGVELSAGATGTSVFTGWLGGCAGTDPTCVVTVDAAKSVIATFAPQGTVATLDVDANASGPKYSALTDGLLIVRYMFGMTGAALTANAVGASPGRSAGQMVGYLANIRPALDVDLDGNVDPFTDGVLVIRHLFGVTGNALVANALAPKATRTDPNDIRVYLLSLMP